MPSMNSPNSSIRARPDRPRLKSISANRANSVKQLEADPSSPDKTVRMSRINEENRQLQAQLKDWELRYDEQLRDVVQRQVEIERTLRTKNTDLEDYATKAKDRVAELEEQLQSMRSALQAAESANVQLEKRVEIMSDLLTTVPPRTDPIGETPGRKRMHIRPRSMLPKLSTTGSWVNSYDRSSDTGTSPALSSSHIRENTLDSFEPLEPIVSREVSAFSPRQSHAGYDSDERPFSATSTTFSDTARQSIDLTIRSTRPMRRMRRFGPGGSTKTLILPFASGFDSLPATAPALEQFETFPSFPLERFISTDSGEGTSPVRSRSNTMAHDETLARLVGSPEPKESSDPETTFRRMLTLARQTSDNRASYISTGSDFGGLVSRNLLEELNAAKMEEKVKKTAELEHTDSGAERAVDSGVEILDSGELSDAEDLDMLPAIQHEDFKAILLSSPMTRICSSPATPQPTAEALEMDVFNPALEGIMGPFNNGSPAPETTTQLNVLVSRSRTPSIASVRSVDALSLSTLDRLRTIFGDLLHHPVDLARLIIHVTQQRMHVPAPLLTVPWWLVNLLWAPMARRRMLQHEPCSNELSTIPESSPSTTAFSTTSTPSLAVSESVAYGTISNSPRSNIRRRAGMAGPGRKRTNSRQHNGSADGLLARHNPLLWAKFSLTLAYAVGTAFTAGPGSLLQGKQCPCKTCRGLDR